LLHDPALRQRRRTRRHHLPTVGVPRRQGVGRTRRVGGRRVARGRITGTHRPTRRRRYSTVESCCDTRSPNRLTVSGDSSSLLTKPTSAIKGPRCTTTTVVIPEAPVPAEIRD